jgi:hypothetical protein
MINKSIKNELLPAAFLVFLAASTRLIPHPANFTALGAMALFSGANIKDRRLGLLLPLITLLITDMILGFHSSMIPVYVCIFFTSILGVKISDKQNLFTIGGSTLLASVVFFLVTNLPFWYADLQLYPMTLSGTLESYTMALPYFGNQLAGDLCYTAAIFGLYRLISRSTTKAVA